MSNEPKVSLSVTDLKEIFKEVISESRKPVVSDRERKELEQVQEERKANAVLVKQERQNKHNLRVNCSHIRRDGTTRAVFVNQGEDQFMICQFCQAIIRGGERPKNDPFPEHFYDTQLFNKLFQMSGAADMVL